MRAAKAYGDVARHTSVMTANSLELVLLLYDKLLQRLREVRAANDKGDVRERGEATGKAIDIIEKGLIGSLDFNKGGDIAKRLHAHYQAWSVLVLRYMANPDPQILEAIEVQVTALREAWDELKRQSPSDWAAQRVAT
jgi:flagellar protein FliS